MRHPIPVNLSLLSTESVKPVQVNVRASLGRLKQLQYQLEAEGTPVSLVDKIKALPDAPTPTGMWSVLKRSKERRFGKSTWKKTPLKLIPKPKDALAFKLLPVAQRDKLVDDAPVRNFDPHDLKTNQPVVQQADLIHFAHHGTDPEPAIVLKSTDGLYVHNGNHRSVAALLSGKKVKAKYIDLSQVPELKASADVIWDIPSESVAKRLQGVYTRLPEAIRRNVRRVQIEPSLGQRTGKFDKGTVMLSPSLIGSKKTYGRYTKTPILIHVFVHECTHGLYNSLPKETVQAWKKLSGWKEGHPAGNMAPYNETRPDWPQGKVKETPSKDAKFSNTYARNEPDDDFTDSTAYILTGNAEQVPPEKVAFITALLKGLDAASEIEPHPFQGEKAPDGHGIGLCKECGKPWKYKAHWRIAADAGQRATALAAKLADAAFEAMVDDFDAVSPPGWKGTVEKMKDHPEIDNPYALAWYEKDKGDESHASSSSEDAAADFMAPGVIERESLKVKALGVESKAYKLAGYTEWQGLPVSIETKKGQVRKGKNADGTEWSVVMPCDYGYFKTTKGTDNQGVDCFLGPVKNAKFVYIVHQQRFDGNGYDEDKCLVNFASADQAKKVYQSAYEDGVDLFHSMSVLPVHEFVQKLLATKGRKRPGKIHAEGMPRRDADGTQDDVDKLMEYRSFGTGKKGYNFASYYRHDGDTQLVVRFKDGIVSDATIVFAGNDDTESKSTETRKGWAGLFSFAQAYGD